MEKTEETKKMTLRDILEYGHAKGMNAEALAKLEETYRGIAASAEMNYQSDD